MYGAMTAGEATTNCTGAERVVMALKRHDLLVATYAVFDTNPDVANATKLAELNDILETNNVLTYSDSEVASVAIVRDYDAVVYAVTCTMAAVFFVVFSLIMCQIRLRTKT